MGNNSKKIATVTTPSKPMKSIVVRVNGGKRDALMYAKSWLADQGSVVGFWYTEKLGDDWLVEVHDGGDGRSYLAPAIKKVKENGGNSGFVIPGTEYALAVELNETSLSKLTLPADDSMSESILDPVLSVMTRYNPRPELFVFLVSVIILIIAVSSFFSAIKARAIPYTVTIKQTDDYQLWNTWVKKIKPNTGDNPYFVKYENGRWIWQIGINEDKRG